MQGKLEAIKNSALWAAYGDALGFITELTDTSGLKRRAAVERVDKTVPWTRLVGGRFGVQINLPAGSYSDDTQLRLSTSRAIRGDGEFDPEAFAKVELPVWTSYALGAGRGTKAAASNLARKDVAWFSNFFDTSQGNYVSGGGNGAAMRIQPHVWAAGNSDTERYLNAVVRNSICTHGHPRGFFGAVAYAICLRQTILDMQILEPHDWAYVAELFSLVPDIIRSDPELGTFWLPTWEDRSRMTIDTATEMMQNEWVADVKAAINNLDLPINISYEKTLDEIGALSSGHRGSGMKSSLASMLLSWLYRDEDPNVALSVSANLLQSDTDTIASMAGAIIGAVSKVAPSNDIQDKGYILYEAERMFKISTGGVAETFAYPELLEWQPPKTQLEVFGLANKKPALAGLGFCESLNSDYFAQDKSKGVWQWQKMEFGQTILCKRRENPKALPVENYPATATKLFSHTSLRRVDSDVKSQPQLRQPALFSGDNDGRNSGKGSKQTKPLSVDQATDRAIRAGFDPFTIGQMLLELLDGENGIERAVAYSAIIAKARIARERVRQNDTNEMDL